MFAHLYDERKAADAAAYLLKRNDDAIHVITLERLLYLAERESFRRHGLPLTGDSLVSFEQGPGLWHTHQRLVGEVSNWRPWMSDFSDYRVGVRPSKYLSAEAYFERQTALSEADLAVLEWAWVTYGNIPPRRLADIIQTECREWDQARAASEPGIRHVELFRALGFSPAETEGVLMQLEEIDSLNQLAAESAA